MAADGRAPSAAPSSRRGRGAGQFDGQAWLVRLPRAGQRRLAGRGGRWRVALVQRLFQVVNIKQRRKSCAVAAPLAYSGGAPRSAPIVLMMIRIVVVMPPPMAVALIVRYPEAPGSRRGQAQEGQGQNDAREGLPGRKQHAGGFRSGAWRCHGSRRRFRPRAGRV